MKNSKQYAQSIQKLYRSLKRKGPKVKKVKYEDIIESLIHAIVLEYMTESASNAAFKKFGDYFVDYNDMRVSRPEEIVEMLGEDTEATRKIAVNIIRVMGVIFRKYNSLNLDSLKKVGKRQAKALLEKFDGVSKFCVDYCMLTALDGHAVPLTENMTAFLKENELVAPESDDADIEGFLTRQISAKNAYEFYSLLRRQSESPKNKKTGRKKTAKSAAKKSPQKTDEQQAEPAANKDSETQNVG